MRKMFCCFLVICRLLAVANADPAGVFRVSAGALLPVVEGFTPGTGYTALIAFDNNLPGLKNVGLATRFGYDQINLAAGPDLGLVHCGLGLELRLPIGKAFSATARTGLSGHWARLSYDEMTTTDSGPSGAPGISFDAGLRLSFQPVSGLAVFTDAEYIGHADLLNALRMTAGLAFSTDRKAGPSTADRNPGLRTSSGAFMPRAGSTVLFDSIGPSGRVDLSIPFTGLKFLNAFGTVGLDHLQLAPPVLGCDLSSFYGAVGLETWIQPWERFALGARTGGGLYSSVLKGSREPAQPGNMAGEGAYVELGLSGALRLDQRYSVHADAGYALYSGLFDGLRLGLGVSIATPQRSRAPSLPPAQGNPLRVMAIPGISRVDGHDADQGYSASVRGLRGIGSVDGLSLVFDVGAETVDLPEGPRLALPRSSAGLLLEVPVSGFMDLGGRLAIGAFGASMYESGPYTDAATTWSGGPTIEGGISFTLLPESRFQIQGEATRFFHQGLFGGNRLSLGVLVALGPEPIGRAARTEEDQPAPEPAVVREVLPRGVTIVSSSFEPLFPVFRKHYDEEPFGKLVLGNGNRSAVSDMTVRFYVKQYMDTPRVCAEIPRLEAGSKVEVDIRALFTDTILDATEATKVSAELRFDYTENGRRKSVEQSISLRVLDRNAMSWADDRRAAAFVTAKDPAVLSFARNAASAITASAAPRTDRNLALAAAVHEALNLHGLSYVIDPTTPHKEFAERSDVVDYLQFPRQTLEYRAGDCDDLSILYTALLESLGIETAFITVPGHILTAFALAAPEAEVRNSYRSADEFIFIEGKAWLPVETTLREGFLEAWKTGAKQWREYASKGSAELIPIRKAWTEYEPVAMPGASPVLTPIDRSRLASRHEAELATFVRREISLDIDRLRNEERRTGSSARGANAIGLLYARYGLFGDAVKEFERALTNDASYVPALMNLGNIDYAQKKLESALGYYERAYRLAAQDARAVLACARVNHDLENYGTVRTLYSRLKELDSTLANRFDYLALRGQEAARAAAVLKEELIWID